eukprot:6391105-Prymnesium_polylepis.1
MAHEAAKVRKRKRARHPWDDCDSHDLAQQRVGRGEDEHIDDLGMAPQRVLDGERGDRLTATIDDLLEAARLIEVPVRVE